MAEINPPAWMQAGSYPARTDRLILSALLSYPGFAVDESTPMRIRQGVKPSYQNYQLKVRAAATPNMTVIVSAGFCFIDNHDAGGLGTYICVNDADRTLNVATAGGTGQYRKDCVVASVYDAETAGSVSEWRLEIIQGTYAASAGAATRPSLPPNCSLLADLSIGPAQTSVAAANIGDVRNFSVGLGGILPVSSSIAPNRMHPGQMQYRTDTDDLYVGTLAGPSRKIREVLRPVVTDQVNQPPTSPLSAFTNFTTTDWPAASVTVPPSGMVKITVGAAVGNTDSTTAAAWVGWRASGALTETTNESNGVSAVGGRVYASRSVVRSGLTPGAALTITPQWWSNTAGAGRRISNGQLILEPIA
ncbi:MULTISPECIES: hypothetical protein [Streptomyces]|uniref:hypothetical protein n=1 Tax=[Kitasatospora] papulosa TaxID=1464011 RepID=UPI0036C30CF8